MSVARSPQLDRSRESPAVRAFDNVAVRFDERFGEWRSVAAQRTAVRRELLRAFPAGSSLLELGGGTGEDALFLAAHERRILLTDGSAAMIECARQKIAHAGLDDRIQTRQVLLEELDQFAATAPRFDGAFSNFAALNCVHDLRPVARGLACMLPAGAHALLVMFGPFSPGDVIVQLARGDTKAAFRRLTRGASAARLGGQSFTVHYATPRRVAQTFAPWFRLVRTRAIGLLVPPSAAEPAISAYPRVLDVLAALDRLAARPFAWLGDHILLDFERTSAPGNAQ